MEYEVITREKGSYIIPAKGERLESEAGALDLVAACGGNGTRGLLLAEEHIPEAFYDLKSGLAGQVLLKFVNYGVRVAAVISEERTRQGRFHEFVIETNRGRDFRVFTTRQAAEDWLLG